MAVSILLIWREPFEWRLLGREERGASCHKKCIWLHLGAGQLTCNGIYVSPYVHRWGFICMYDCFRCGAGPERLSSVFLSMNITLQLCSNYPRHPQILLCKTTMPPSTHHIEYAKSSRSNCKRCKEKIDKGVLRIVSSEFSWYSEPTVWANLCTIFMLLFSHVNVSPPPRQVHSANLGVCTVSFVGRYKSETILNNF